MPSSSAQYSGRFCMAKKKKPHYYVIACTGKVWVFLTVAQAQVECYCIYKDMTGDERGALEYSNSIDKNFQTPPYPPNKTEALDKGVLEQIINDISFGL